nr:hypothetical protein [Tanacetum cinerariifolium]
ESVSKQGRKNAKPVPTLDDSPFDDLDVDLAHGMDYMESEEAVNEGRTSSKTEELNVTNDVEKGSDEKGGSTKDPVSTTMPKEVGIAMPEVSTARILADSTAHPIPTTVFKDEDIFLDDALPLPTIDPKDKGKRILEEEPEPVNVKSKGQDEAQMAMDEELRSQMMTYLRHVGGYKHAQLNRKSFKEIQVLYERQKKHVQDFVPIGFAEDKRRIEEINKKAGGEDTSTKRIGDTRMKIMSKRKKTDSDLEEEEHLKTFLKIVQDEEGIIDYENLKSWDFYENCEVHTLILEDGIEIHMLAEGMMSLKLIDESASDSAYNLLRF